MPQTGSGRPGPAPGRGADGTAPEEIHLGALRVAPHQGPVLYASMPSQAKLQGPGAGINREGEKRRLVALLWRRLGEVDGAGGGSANPGKEGSRGIATILDPLGKPHLIGGGAPGLSISFTYGAHRVWAALCGGASHLGIDAARAADFSGAYPRSRVFLDEEFQEIKKITHGDLQEAAALLWSVKEAVVKSLGCAFHFFGPRQVWVSPAGGGEAGPLFFAGLTASTHEKFPFFHRGVIPVAALRRGEAWLACALAPPRSLMAVCLPLVQARDRKKCRPW